LNKALIAELSPSLHVRAIERIEDARKQKSSLPTGPAEFVDDYAPSMNALAGTQFRTVMGLPRGRRLSRHAERGEALAFVPLTLRQNTVRPDWLRTEQKSRDRQGLKPNPRDKNSSMFEFISSDDRPVAELY